MASITKNTRRGGQRSAALTAAQRARIHRQQARLFELSDLLAQIETREQMEVDAGYPVKARDARKIAATLAEVEASVAQCWRAVTRFEKCAKVEWAFPEVAA